ncbi:MAG: Crp/Fnr family transcriptional regulator [Treponema socranskii subsp. buccale]|uniref:Crp/Fnr family transcriptional regulator n=1 Tax=Treponema socranskii TaxID=53419 RepID=UPI0015D78DFB|nr:Crp/Fnr family transcriptional regulator [Treponema socranskii]UTD02151.1 Crp/Fnr family transcriptional regulator [Treponema socranskii subsp. buccale]
MPKAMQYTKGSIVYFEGDKDERIFILQKGILVLTTTDVETHQPVTEQVKNGEFFGVKSALGRFPREETATALTDCVSIALTIQEFEQIFSSNKEIIMKMLRVFSNQLRLIHKKTEAILNNVPEDQQTGMIAVAKSFYNDEEYLSCCDICVKFLSLYPNTAKKDEVAKLYADAKLRNTKIKEKIKSSDTTEEDEEASGALKQFALPAFKRFAKQYKPGNVIISEFEPGNSFYLIQSGRVQLVKCVNGAKKNLDIMKPGEFFGEMAILDNSPRSATCVAIGNVECLEFNKENFQLLIMGNPQIAIILLKLFCKRIYDQRRRLRTLAIKDVQARIADVFLMFDEMNPSVNANDRQRKFNVSAADVAHWAGLSPEATRDEINKFVEKRKIEVYDNYIIVDNIADMKRIVDTRSGLSEQK